MKAKHRKILEALFKKPTLGTIVFAEIQSLVKALGGEVGEDEGSRVALTSSGQRSAQVSSGRTASVVL